MPEKLTTDWLDSILCADEYGLWRVLGCACDPDVEPEMICGYCRALDALVIALAPPPEAPLREAGNCTTCDGHGTVFGEWCECERYCPDCDGTTKESPDA